MKLMRKNGGFTLVELIVVIAILAILAGIAVPAYSGYIQKAEKAADMQLLGAVNESFQAACVAESTTAAAIRTATLDWDGNKVVGIASVNGAYNDAIDSSFKMFYAGNEGTEFKVLANKLVFMGGVFAEIDSAYADVFNQIINNPEMSASIGAFKNSAFANISANDLMGQVADVSSLASLLIQSVNEDGTPSALTSIVMSEAYRETMAQKLGYEDGDAYFAAVQEMMNENPQAAADYMANSTILNVANTVNGWDATKEQAAKNDLMNLDYSGMVSKINNPDQAEEGLAQAAMLYGMYTAFDPEGAKTLLSGEDAGLSSLQNLGSKTNASGVTFEQYLAGLNDSTSQASKDFAGYKGALDVVNEGVSSDTDTANKVMTDGYDDGTLAALLQQVIG